jgi:hypothetical protein
MAPQQVESDTAGIQLEQIGNGDLGEAQQRLLCVDDSADIFKTARPSAQWGHWFLFKVGTTWRFQG